MRLGFVLDDGDLAIQLRALDAARCDQIVKGDALDVVKRLSGGDVLVVWRIDKLATDLSRLQRIIKQVHDSGASLELIFERINSRAGGDFNLPALVNLFEKI
ncbi:hypothetical protein AU461_23265 [Vibrio parahaemolyticus]|uniref:recombinase family protein n=1 Tax=Vibrio parahaemolyticus TaxID=670 RepID=UPI000789B566|nr:recombinase family protein [Vibrio parahaemolyticus]KYO58439.1 hypothetical protein AU461_23265 [Vibrio parahaemolyticus]KYX47715.1 hypothetical protein AU389_01920 [Vibrio parahaemolyticus]